MNSTEDIVCITDAMFVCECPHVIVCVTDAMFV